MFWPTKKKQLHCVSLKSSLVTTNKVTFIFIKVLLQLDHTINFFLSLFYEAYERSQVVHKEPQQNGREITVNSKSQTTSKVALSWFASLLKNVFLVYLVPYFLENGFQKNDSISACTNKFLENGFHKNTWKIIWKVMEVIGDIVQFHNSLCRL